ncbi:MAG: hypothetical protein GFGODING_02317 [Flavobacteriales bacterium]|nr:hypothetical protein [Flavobacteriales bacterium]
MIDYAKIELPVEVGARLLHHPALSFIGKFDHATGAVLGDAPCIAEYGPRTAIGRTNDTATDRRALQFIVYPSGRTILHGSFHKYAQGGANWGDYTFTQFAATVAELCDTFNLDPHMLRLLQLEAGANVEPPLRTSRTLQAIVCHREGHPFGPMRSSKGRSLGIVMERDQYAVKVYDKGRQYARPGELLRFELKFTKAIEPQRLGIYTVNDLLNPGAWHRLRARIMDIYGELFIAEPSIHLPRLNASQRTFVELARSPHYWQELNRGARHKARARYAAIVERFAGSNLKDALGRTLDAKLNDLLNVPLQASARGDVFTDIPAGYATPSGERFHGSVKVGIRSPRTSIVDDSSEGDPLQRTTEEQRLTGTATGVRRCLTCGRDITDQRPGSRYCSESRYGKDGKRCRNAGSNPRNNRLRSLQRIEREPLLFDHRPFVVAETMRGNASA